MTRQNLHTHTLYDDGKNTPAEMAQAALDAGLTSLGFSGHSVLPYENDWAMTAQSFEKYLADVRETREAFAGRLSVFLGLEWDLLSDPPEGFDYIIGSAHHLPAAGPTFTVDEAPALLRDAVTRCFRGDASALAAAYFRECEKLAACPFVDIVGHIDLLTKFNEKDPVFDTDAPLYRDAAVSAVETLLRADKLFEVNTGAISRGWRTAPYPSVPLLKELKARRARVLISSDAHAAGAVTCAFRETEELLRSAGFREQWELTETGFRPVPL